MFSALEYLDQTVYLGAWETGVLIPLSCRSLRAHSTVSWVFCKALSDLELNIQPLFSWVSHLTQRNPLLAECSRLSPSETCSYNLHGYLQIWGFQVASVVLSGGFALAGHQVPTKTAQDKDTHQLLSQAKQT